MGIYSISLVIGALGTMIAENSEGQFQYRVRLTHTCKEITHDEYQQYIDPPKTSRIAFNDPKLGDGLRRVTLKKFMSETSTTIHPFRKGSGRVFPTKFIPPSSNETPLTLFACYLIVNYKTHGLRFLNRRNRSQLLMFVSGACISDGRSDAKAGWAVILNQRTPKNNPVFTVSSGRLELVSPFGDCEQQTSDRAELRAAIGALRYREWPDEGHKSIVLVSDSEYLIEGATARVAGWIRNGWKTNARKPVKNKDL